MQNEKDNMKIINGHTYDWFYAGIVTYVIDGWHCYDIESAAKALGLTVHEFKQIW